MFMNSEGGGELLTCMRESWFERPLVIFWVRGGAVG